MNHDPFLPDTDDEREWAAQERALAEQRAGLAPEAGDPQLRSYRVLADLLAQPPELQLPPDFARRTARRVQQATRPVESRFERNLLGLLAVAMVVASLCALVQYGAAWLPALDPMGGQLLAKPWLWVLAGCVGMTALCDRWWLRGGPAA